MKDLIKILTAHSAEFYFYGRTLVAVESFSNRDDVHTDITNWSQRELLVWLGY